MAFHFLELDGTTRSFMMEEVDHDTTRGILYLSPRLTDRGRRDWPELLRAAVRDGDEEVIAESLRGTGRLREVETRHDRGGSWRTHEARVPATAAQTLAEGEFNRFYIRGLCLRAASAGFTEVQVYRAKRVGSPRPDSVRLIDSRLQVAQLLDDLRAHSVGKELTFKVPGGPNSGLSVRLPTLVVSHKSRSATPVDPTRNKSGRG